MHVHCDNGLEICVLRQEFSQCIIYIRRENPLLVDNMHMLVDFGDILPETSKSSACWDVSVHIPIPYMAVQ